MRTGISARAVQGRLWEEDEKFEVSSVAEKYLGKAGRVLHMYRNIKHPTTIFNASIFTENGKRIWYGDLDLRQAGKGLQRLSLQAGMLFIHYEISWYSQDLKLSPEEIRTSAVVKVEQGRILYNRAFMERMRELKEQTVMRSKHDRRISCERRFLG